MDRRLFLGLLGRAPVAVPIVVAAELGKVEAAPVPAPPIMAEQVWESDRHIRKSDIVRWSKWVEAKIMGRQEVREHMRNAVLESKQ